MLYVPYLEAFELSMWSGLPFGTIPPEVTTAIVALLISLIALPGSTLSNTGIGYSVTNGLSAIFLRSISTALFEPLLDSKKLTR